MKIVHISTSDIQGGAARSAYRLHQGLKQIGDDSTMLVAHKHSEDPNVTRIRHRYPRDWFARAVRRRRLKKTLQNAVKNAPRRSDYFSLDRCWCGSIPLRYLPRCDVVNLHWTAKLLDWSVVLPRLAARFRGRVRGRGPVVWTLHDMNTMTGGCHYTFGCDRFTDRCGACPQLGSRHENDLSRTIWQRKQNVLAQMQNALTLVTPSQWLAREARRSSLLQSFPIHVIPYGLDTQTFAPTDQIQARAALGIPADAAVVFFVAQTVDQPRKGFALLQQALAELTDLARLHLVSIGHGEPQVPPGIAHQHLGSIDSDAKLAEIYSAADVTVVPSLQDNLPNTVLESMACGTPVVGFDIGGMPDMVRPEQTGLLAPEGDVLALAGAVHRILTDASLREHMRTRCRAVVESEYTLENQAKAYHQLYASLVKTAGCEPAAVE